MADNTTSSTERVTVTYAASQALLAAPLTPHFINLLREQLPLRNLHWRPSQSTLEAVAARAASQDKSSYTSTSVVPGSTIRTIQTLDVALKPLTDEIRRWRGDPGYFEQPGTAGLLDRPFVHLYLVVCEDSEHYRTTVRNEIRSWLSTLSFFHSKQAGSGSQQSAVGTPTLASSSRTSLGLGSFRSGTPSVRSDTPPTTGTGSGPNTPTNQGVPVHKTAAAANINTVGPTEPEYLIVLITPPEGSGISGLSGPAASVETKTGMSRFMNKSKGNVLEKARADFNTSKKEHVIQLSRLPPVPVAPLSRPGLQSHSMDPTIWAELLTKMREAASSTFTITIEAQEEEIARCGVTKGNQGWDFCSYFLAKDSLARTLEVVGLKDDAVGQYEDLEIVFAQAIQNGAVSFARVGGDDTKDDSLPLLDVSKKLYAELIRRREISLFDFRCYLFARKSALLGKMGRVAAVMREAPVVISAVGRMLRKNRRLSSQRIESWIFSAALDVVEQCQAWLIQRGGQSTTGDDDQLSPAFHSNKSELLDMARRQLDRIGIEAGHLPPAEPFSFPSPSDTESGGKERDLPPLPDAAAVQGLGAAVVLGEQPKCGSSRPELQRAIESKEHFDAYYLAMCERILAGWKASSRKRDALNIRTIVATLHYLRGKYQLAYDSLVGLTEAYALAKFALLEGHALAMQLECHAKLEKVRDRGWIAAALAALPVSVNTSAGARSVEEGAAKWTDAAYLCSQLREASMALEREVPVSGFPLFSISVPSAPAKLVGTEDGSLITVDVTSLLPCSQAVEDIRMCLVTAGGGDLWYTSSRTELKPGTTNVELFCPHPAHGVYTVDVTQIRIARLIFQYDHAASAATKEPIVVRVPKDGAAPNIAVNLPRQIDLDQPRAVEVTMHSGRNNIDSAELSVVFADGSSAVDCAAAKLGASTAKPDTAGTANTIALRSLDKDGETVVVLPLTTMPDSGVLNAIVTLTYVTTSGSNERYAAGKKRTLTLPFTLRTALPLGVNVQDFFRTNCLLSKFTISAGGGGSIRLKPVTLAGEDAEGYTIASCGSGREATVTPRQPATFLFRISKKDGANTGGKRMRLAVLYRALEEDAVCAAKASLDRVVKDKGVAVLGKGEPGRILLEEALAKYVRDRLDLPAYSITGVVRVGTGLDEGWWRSERRSWAQTSLDLTSLLELVHNTLDSISSGSVEGEGEVWQKLTIPVDVPSIDYVDAVTLSLHSGGVEVGGGEGASIVVGLPVQLTLTIRTSTQWSDTHEDGEGEEMVYDIVPDFENWIVDGAKRGIFSPSSHSSSSTAAITAPVPLKAESSDDTFSATLTVVPLRTGNLALPTVLVRPLSAVNAGQQRGEGKRIPTCETYTTNAGTRVQVVPAKSTKAFYVPTVVGDGQRFSGRGGERESWKHGSAGGAGGLDRSRAAWSQPQQQASQIWQAHA